MKRAALLLALAASLLGAACGRFGRGAARVNILVFTIDTLRADHVGAYGSTSGATPNIDAFAREAVLFENAITPAPLTLPAHTAIFSGLLPFRNGVRVNGTDRVAENVPLLAAEFSAARYDTAAFISSLVLRGASGISRGFAAYDEAFAANEGKAPREYVAERKGGETADRALAWLAGRRARKKAAPFFLWVHFYDPHAPYEPPAPFAEKFRGHPYDGEIAYADSCLARVLSAIDPENTVVVLAGDHGESLGEHGENGHGVFLYDATVRVPLLIRLARKERAGSRIATQVRLADVAPTLRRLGGLPAVESDGEDLSPLFDSPRAPDRPAFSESDYPAFVLGWSPMRCLRWRGEKFIEAPKREFYELARDPGERTNRYAESEEKVRALAREMAKIVARKPLAESTSSAVDPEVARRLASLGYISGGSAAVDYERIDSSRVDPKDHIEVWTQIESGLIARQTKRYERAVTIFERVLASYPTLNPVILRDYAEACRWTGRLDRALELYARILSTAKPEPDDFFGLGVTWHLKKNEARACESFERAVAMDATDVNAWIDLGNGRLSLGSLDAAARAFSRAAVIDSRSVDALSGLAAVAFEKRDLDTAEAMLRRAFAAAPENPETQFNLALVARARGRGDTAREIYRALGESPNPSVSARARRELQALDKR